MKYRNTLAIQLISVVMFLSACGAGSILSNAPSERVLWGKWKQAKEQGGQTLEFFDDGKGSMFGVEMKYSWLKDGKHLRFEYSAGVVQIFEASLQDDALKLTQNDYLTVYKRVK